MILFQSENALLRQSMSMMLRAEILHVWSFNLRVTRFRVSFAIEYIYVVQVMKKITATPIYIQKKNLKIFFSRTTRPIA